MDRWIGGDLRRRFLLEAFALLEWSFSFLGESGSLIPWVFVCLGTDYSLDLELFIGTFMDSEHSTVLSVSRYLAAQEFVVCYFSPISLFGLRMSASL